MNERTSKKPGIADYVAAHRKHRDCFLDEINRLIDWKPLEKVLRNKLKRVANAVGNPAYPPLLMFKILLLQRWYNLSDMAVEEALCDRLSFVRFTGLSLDHDEVPDSTTICRFRQSLVERNILKRLLDKLNHQLERQGLLVREGTIVDASVVSSARRPFKVLDVLPEDREEDAGDAPDVTISYSDDADAAWLRKGNRAYYGYKIHAAKRGTRFEALEPIRQGVRHSFGAFGKDVAKGLTLRHDHGSQFISDDFQNEIKFLGIKDSASYVREPQGNGIAERFVRILKENLLWVRSFNTVEELRLALLAFKEVYNQRSQLGYLLGERSPANGHR